MLGLIDLEELVQRCRDAKTRELLREATDCYKIGAYRSAIVSTWVALVYDLIEKFRELALTGDAAATALVEEIDQINATRDTDNALRFERSVLEKAKDQFELISAQEFAELARLREDRNRFAHPNLNQDSEQLSATAELARLHLRSAIEHVLSRPPVQGKAALEGLLALVESEYFPQESDAALTALSSSVLRRAKKNLIKAFVFGAITSVLREEMGPQTARKRISAARACYLMHPSIVASLLADGFTHAVSSTSDKKIPYLLYLVARFPELAAYLDPATKIRLERYVSTIAGQELVLAVYAGEIEFLGSLAEAKLNSLSASELRTIVEILPITPTKLLIDSIVRKYRTSKNWDSANTLASAIQAKLLSALSPDDAKALVAAHTNGEVLYSFGYPTLVKALLQAKKISLDWLSSVFDMEDAKDAKRVLADVFASEREDGGPEIPLLS